MSMPKANKHKAHLIEGPVGRMLVKLTIPMIFGMVSMFAFHLVDTFFIGKLGTHELAALSFTLPVIMVIASLALGLGIGTSSVVSRAIGEGNHHKVERLTTDSLILAILVVAFCAAIGLKTIDPLFRLLGATPEILPLIRQYMLIWYSGVIFVVIPMIGNNAIRATGDTKTPSVIMIGAVVVNMILDPLLIFGIGPFPRLELAGAAIATVAARAVSFFIALWVLSHREKMINFTLRPFRRLVESWKSILYIGLPSAGTRVMISLAMGIVTRLVASYGPAAVAGFGVSARIELFAMTVIFALASVIGPFVGQNWGANLRQRVKLGIGYSKRFALGWGVAMLLLLAFAARPIASLFSNNPDVISIIVLYLRITPIGYGLLGVLVISMSSLMVLNKPLHAVALTIVQMFVIYVPLAFVGSHFFGLPGVFIALSLGYIITGVAAHFLLGGILQRSQLVEIAR
jgi:putative MATE family efflux protein